MKDGVDTGHGGIPRFRWADEKQQPHERGSRGTQITWIALLCDNVLDDMRKTRQVIALSTIRVRQG